MRSISGRRWFLIAVSALLQLLCFPISGPLPWWRSALSWVALLPFLLALLEANGNAKPLSLRHFAALGYVCGILWYMGNCAWIYQTMYLYGGMAKPVALAILLLFSLYLGLYHALFAFILGLLRKLYTTGCVLALAPFLWVAMELARARITAFPWDLLGYSQVDNLLLTRLAPLMGVMSISFVLAAVNSLLCFSMLHSGAQRFRLAGATVLAAASLQVGGLPVFYLRASEPMRRAVLLQENLSVGATALNQRPLGLEQELETFSALSMAPVLQASRFASKPDIIVWPEAPSHLLSVDPGFLAAMSVLAHRAAAPLIVGSLGVDFDPVSPQGRYVYDSAVVFDRTGKSLGRYDKVHLVPWGEYIPYKKWFTFAQKLTEGAGDMDRGKKRSTFQLDGRTYGVFVCYESIFGDEIREFVKNGAEVLVNISDDGWYGDTGAPWQHLNMARMRAIENHRWVIRDTNTGETTTIDPQGRYTATPRHVRTAYELPFAFETGTTFYTRHGDWFAWLCVVVTVLGCLSGLVTRGRPAAGLK